MCDVQLSIGYITVTVCVCVVGEGGVFASKREGGIRGKRPQKETKKMLIENLKSGKKTISP